MHDGAISITCIDIIDHICHIIDSTASDIVEYMHLKYVLLLFVLLGPLRCCSPMYSTKLLLNHIYIKQTYGSYHPLGDLFLCAQHLLPISNILAPVQLQLPWQYRTDTEMNIK